MQADNTGAAMDAVDRYRLLPQWSWRGRRGEILRGRHRRAPAGEPTIHWLSGNGFSAGVYWPFLRRLPEHWGLLTHDIEGHGESDPAGRFVGVRRTVERARHVLSQRAPGRPRIAMGHSFGAALSLRLAARWPEAFDLLVLLDPIIMPRRYWFGVKAAAMVGRLPFAEASRRRRERWNSRAEARAHLDGRGIYAGWEDEAMDAFIAYAMRDDGDGCRLACAPEVEAQIFENPLFLWRDLRRLQVPTLLLHGRDSYFFIAPAATRAAALQPSLRAHSVPGGHCFMQQHPADTAETVTRWIREQLGSTG